MRFNPNVKRKKIKGEKDFYYFINGVSPVGITRRGDFKMSDIIKWPECSVGAMTIHERLKLVGKKGGYRTVYSAICGKSRRPVADKKRIERESQDFTDFLCVMQLMKPL